MKHLLERTILFTEIPWNDLVKNIVCPPNSVSLSLDDAVPFSRTNKATIVCVCDQWCDPVLRQNGPKIIVQHLRFAHYSPTHISFRDDIQLLRLLLVCLLSRCTIYSIDGMPAGLLVNCKHAV